MGARGRTPVPSASLAGLILLLLLLAVMLLGHGFPVAAIGAGTGEPAARSSSPPRALLAARARAIAVAEHRPGRVAFALATPDGAVVGDHSAMTFPSASLVKSLLAVALLRSERWARNQVALDDGARMIRWSDNAAATRTLARLGPERVRESAAAAGLRDFQMGMHWSEARASARDYARLLAELPTLVPSGQRARLSRWLGTVIPSQSWGIPEALRPLGARVLFKGGWRGGLVHQAARVEWRGSVYGLAVLTSDQPGGLATGVPTIREIARRALAPRSAETAGVNR